MKIVINKTGKTEDIDSKIALRMINRGTAHYAKEQKTVPEIKKEIIEADLLFDGIEKVFVKPKVKVLKKPKRLTDIPDEIFEMPKKRSRKKKSKFRKWND